MIIRGLRPWLALVLVTASPLAVAGRVHAQPVGDVEPPPPDTEPDDTGEGDDDADDLSAEGPAEAGASVEIDTRQQELERAQRELERSQEQDQANMVVDPVSVEVSPEDSRSHNHQVGIRVGAGVPFIFAIKYTDGPRCDKKLTNDGEYQQFCGRVGPAVLDIDLGFGVNHSLELSLGFRVGLADDQAAEARPYGLSFGVRSFPAPHAIFKFYLGGRLYLDITPGGVGAEPAAGSGSYGTADIGARGEMGFIVDPVRFFGIYAQAGMTVLFLRGFYFVPDLTGGIQVRFP